MCVSYTSGKNTGKKKYTLKLFIKVLTPLSGKDIGVGGAKRETRRRNGRE